jgi:hypothetical protein
MFWSITNGKYQIIDSNALNSYQNIVLTLSIVAPVASNTTQGVIMKEKPDAISHDLEFFVLFMESLFINLCDFLNEYNLSLLDVVVLVFVNWWIASFYCAVSGFFL